MDSILGLLPLPVLFPIGYTQELLLILLSPQCLSQASMVPLLPQGLPELLQSIQPVSLLSEALFVQFEPDGIVVPCIGFT